MTDLSAEQLIEVLKTICETDTYGTKYWSLNGQHHRIDGPAVEFVDGVKFWYLNGQKHRVDGPAIESVRGPVAWYLNDVEYTEEQFNKQIKI